MTRYTKIAWCDHTFNPWIGCTNISPGCDRCYAEELMDTRYKRVQWGPHGERSKTSAANWKEPLHWAKVARTMPNAPRERVFCASLADVLDNKAPQEWRDELWAVVHATPELDWLFLTKRPQNYYRMAPVDWIRNGCPPHVWWGISVEDQHHYDARIDHLHAIEARVRFLSVEPMLGPVRLRMSDYRHIHWVICGGESGRQARAMEPAWARVLRNDTHDIDARFFFKQTGSKTWAGPRSGKGDDPQHWPPDLKVQDFPEPREWPRAA